MLENILQTLTLFNVIVLIYLSIRYGQGRVKLYNQRKDILSVVRRIDTVKQLVQTSPLASDSPLALRREPRIGLDEITRWQTRLQQIADGKPPDKVIDNG